ncbi:MAG: LacI family transcriptional regulator [Candidatus Hydrogenedentota bacterium]
MTREVERWTIHDIARELGVSAMTISRVINNDKGVGQATRERVQQFIEEVGYQPHSGARSLRGTHRDCIGVTLPAPPELVPISQDMLTWLFAELWRIFGLRRDYIVFDLNPFDGENTLDYARGLWQRRCGGCVIAGPLPTNDKIVELIHRKGHPYLTLGRLDSFPETSFATVDYDKAAYLSTKFLIDKGHRCIGLLKALTGYQPGVERLRGYRRALDEAGIPFDEALVRPTNFQAGHLASMVYRLLHDTRVTAVVDCSGTGDAEGIRAGSARAGRIPGKDYEIVVWTYVYNKAILPEASAHVWLPVRDAATEGLELLGKWFHGEAEGPVQVLYPPMLMPEVTGGILSKPQPVFDLITS